MGRAAASEFIFADGAAIIAAIKPEGREAIRNSQNMRRFDSQCSACGGRVRPDQRSSRMEQLCGCVMLPSPVQNRILHWMARRNARLGPDAVGEYVIQKTLGEGAFSKVKLAVHRPTNSARAPMHAFVTGRSAGGAQDHRQRVRRCVGRGRDGSAGRARAPAHHPRVPGACTAAALPCHNTHR